jgi:hypothetical protein
MGVGIPITDLVAITDGGTAIVSGIGLSLSDTFTITDDGVAIGTYIVLSDTVSLGDAVSEVSEVFLSIADSLSMSDGLSNGAEIALSDTFTYTDPTPQRPAAILHTPGNTTEVRVYPETELLNTFNTGDVDDIKEDIDSLPLEGAPPTLMSDRLRSVFLGEAFKSTVTEHGFDFKNVSVVRFYIAFNQTETQTTTGYKLRVYDQSDTIRGEVDIAANTQREATKVVVDVPLSPVMTKAEAMNLRWRIDTQGVGAGDTEPTPTA